MAQKDIPRLLDQVRELVDSPANQSRYALWPAKIQPSIHGDFGAYRYWFPTPANHRSRIPYSLEVEPALWHKVFDLDLEQFYTDPLVYLEYWLRITLYRFEHFHTDTPLTKTIDIDFGSVFVQSLFGVDVIYSSQEGPWVGLEPVWKTERALASARFPNFYTSGLSPLAHRFYDEIREMVGEDFRVHFVSWRKGPFSLLTHLRGYVQLLLDFYDRPHFVHQMMALVSEAMKAWYAERTAFTGGDRPGPIYLGNDEVGTPSISPAIYEEFVLPYEIDLSHAFGGIDYWHSCGNTTQLAPLIARIPNVHMFDVGPWTELRPAVEAYRQVPGASIMRRLNPVTEVLLADERQLRQPLYEVREVCTGKIPVMVMYDGLNYLEDWETDFEKIHELDRACDEILHTSAPDGEACVE